MPARHKKVINVPCLLYICVANQLAFDLSNKRIDSLYSLDPELAFQTGWGPCVDLFFCVVATRDEVDRRMIDTKERKLFAKIETTYAHHKSSLSPT